MPYSVRHKPVKSSKKDYAIMKKEGGNWKIVGRSSSKKKAEASVRARQENE